MLNIWTPKHISDDLVIFAQLLIIIKVVLSKFFLLQTIVAVYLHY